MSYLGIDQHLNAGLDTSEELIETVKDLHPKIEKISDHLVDRACDDRERIRQLEKLVADQAAEIARLKAGRGDHYEAVLSDMNEKLSSIHDHIMEQEKVIVIRELSDEEAMRILIEEILPTRDTIDTLAIAETLKIPIDQAHSLFIKLIEQGRLGFD